MSHLCQPLSYRGKKNKNDVGMAEFWHNTSCVANFMSCEIPRPTDPELATYWIFIKILKKSIFLYYCFSNMIKTYTFNVFIAKSGKLDKNIFIFIHE